MANRYWYGGTDTWDGTAGSKWSDIDNVSGVGKSVPISTDNVFFTAGAGAVTVTATSSATCNNLTTTGFTGTINVTANSSSKFNIYGDIVLYSGTTLSGTLGNIGWNPTGTVSITCNGATITVSMIMIGGTGTANLADTFTTTKNFRVVQGTFNTNNYDMYMDQLSFSTALGARTINLGSSNIYLSNTFGYSDSGSTQAGGLTINAGTSNIILTYSGTCTMSTNISNQNFITLHKITMGASCTSLTINNGLTVDTITSLRTNSKTLNISSGKTIYITNLDLSGTVSKITTIKASSAGSPFTFSKSSGAVSPSYVSLKDSTATGGASWIASYSTDAGGNTGWTISDGLLVVGEQVLVSIPSITTNVNALPSVVQTTVNIPSNAPSVKTGTISPLQVTVAQPTATSKVSPELSLIQVTASIPSYSVIGDGIVRNITTTAYPSNVLVSVPTATTTQSRWNNKHTPKTFTWSNKYD